MAKVFVITGPSGVGKGTLIRSLLDRIPTLELSVSATTRSPRPGEQDGVHYRFLTREQFAARWTEHGPLVSRFPGLLHSWPVMSPHAHARIVSIDTTAALADCRNTAKRASASSIISARYSVAGR